MTVQIDPRAEAAANQRRQARISSLTSQAYAIRAAAEGDGRDFTPGERDELEHLLGQIDQWQAAGKPTGQLINNDGTSEDRRAALRQSFGGGPEKPLSLKGSWRFADFAQRDANWATFGDFAKAVIGNPHDPRLRNDASEGAGPDGGYSVPGQYASEILDTAIEGSLANLCNRFPMQYQSMKVWGIADANHSTSVAGFSTYWLGENETATSQQPTLRQIELKAKKLFVLTKISSELSMDSPNFESVLGRKMADSINCEISRCIVRGTGAGQPLGILNSACLISVAEDSSQAAATLSVSNVLRMYERLLPQSYANAVWLISPSCRSQLYSLEIEGTSNSSPAFFAPGGLPNSPNGTLLGLPIIFSEHCSVLGTLGDVILADMKAYAFGARMDVSVSSSIHAGFDADQIWWRAIARCDGQPMLNAAQTLRDGSTTASTFVTLDTRSGG